MTKRKPPEELLKTGRHLKWTEEVALELANGLIAWLNASDENIYWEEYLIKVRDLAPQRISDLSSRYPSFMELIKKAKKLQEFKLLKKEGKGEIKSIFVLKNHHGYADKQEIKSDNKTTISQPDKDSIARMSLDELKDTIRTMTSPN